MAKRTIIEVAWRGPEGSIAEYPPLEHMRAGVALGSDAGRVSRSTEQQVSPAERR